MQKPVVLLYQCAMNESVATTCCYRQVPTATVLYWEVLHGGWVGNGFVEQLRWHDELTTGAAWIRHTGVDLTLAEGKTWAQVSERAEQYEVVLMNQVKKMVHKQNYVAYEGSIQSGMQLIMEVGSGNDLIKVVQDCGHSDLTRCKMKYLDQCYADNQHFEATSSHDVKGDQSWKKAHDARQYSS